MSEQENIEFAKQALSLFESDGPESVIPFMAEDVEVHASANLANSGTFKGHDGYREWCATWFDVWDEFRIEVASIETPSPDLVLVPCRQHARGRGSGLEVAMDACYAFATREGLVAQFHLYSSYDEALSAIDTGELGGGSAD